MSKTIAILLVLAAVWATAWGIAGYFMHQAGGEKVAQAQHVSTPSGPLVRGGDVRVEGTILGSPAAVAPFSKKSCLAALTSIAITSSYRDSQNKTVWASNHIATRRVGPANLEVAVGDGRIELPLERWVPRYDSFIRKGLAQVPADLGVTPAEIASAKAQARGNLGSYMITEATLDAGTRFLVIGRLEDRDGPLRLEADRMLGRVELYPGSQDDFVKELRGSGAGLGIAGWILGAGVGPLPLTIMALVLVVRRKRGAASAPRARPFDR
jgi:hypothetical protein